MNWRITVLVTRFFDYACKIPLLIEWQNVQASESIPLPILIVAKVPFDVLPKPI
ncbi:hypothetical protein [Lysinibacillus sphaericus]|uniref:hypothetical protein n=1 Tax=Lysinibacillus sphaericus TaxID=1421 RepID=UPI003D7F7A71